MKGQKSRLCIQTITESKLVECFAVSGLEVSDVEQTNTVPLPEVYAQEAIPASKEDAVAMADIEGWPYLSEEIQVQERLEDDEEAHVGLLIGNNVPKLLEPIRVVNSQNDGPYACQTLLGWAVYGLPKKQSSPASETRKVSSHRIMVADLERQIRQMYNQDFNESIINDEPQKSVEDRKFLQLVEETVTFEDGHYTIGLPRRSPEMKMPDNRPLAEQRAAHLKRKLSRNEVFYDEYNNFMTDMLENGYAEKVPLKEKTPEDGCKWYLPHHGVYHPQKQKLRVVFDCAARYHGTSLNDQLLQGPDLTNSLTGVLTRFRQEPVAVMADIKSMFYQVRVPKADADLMRFLWWPEGDLSQPLHEYRMVVHTFGATSSPSCANYALRKTAKDKGDNHEPRVTDTIYDNFYVDDCLCSVPTEDEAVSLANGLRKVCASGGFCLTKWISNSREVMRSIPEAERAKQVKGLDLNQNLPQEKALGMLWSVENDSFGYKIDLKKQPSTRRGILSTVSSVYDPLGFIAPAILPAKQILQDLCRRQCGWDDPISDHNLIQWQKWLSDLPGLSNFEVERCIKPENYGEPERVQIHHFCDASEIGYGTVSYIRMENDCGIHCSFLTSKARVTPIKQVSIPRLELTAATVAVKVNAMLHKELKIEVDDVHYWTDSMSVLRYIENTTARFQTFVANRVNIIREGSTPDQWHYVKSADNPADDSSRGLSVEALLGRERWLKGPPFLWRPEHEWPVTEIERSQLKCSSEDPEVKIAASRVQNKAVVVQDDLDNLMSHYSNWYRLKRAVGWILRVKQKLLSQIKKRRLTEEDKQVNVVTKNKQGEETVKAVESKTTAKETTSGARQNHGAQATSIDPLTLDEMHAAERAVIAYVQWKAFPLELSSLKETHADQGNTDCIKDSQTRQNTCVKKTSHIFRLQPFKEDGVLRVGGRLAKAALPEETKFPSILPKESPITELVMRDAHKATGHGGRNHMLAFVRKRYWVINANTAARRVINKCVTCRRQKGKVGEQQMANLPEDRVTPDNPPFTHVGMDYFGPFEIKRGRSLVKRYGVVFTCLSTRAIHLEKADSLDTDSCINAIRRFVARRGQVQEIRSDNGTNLVGAQRELKAEIQRWNQAKIHSCLLQKGIEWNFNTPAASHFGGIWERQIRTVRKIMMSTIKEQTLTDESLCTLLCEVEAIINSRPITTAQSDPGDLEPLTPNHLLLLKGKPSLPPVLAEETGPYARRRWKQVQYLADLFWRRWTREYLLQLQERQKWVRPRANFKTGDVVLVVDNSQPRNTWIMGKVINTMPDKMGLVRRVEIRTKSSVLTRPIHKLCLLLGADE